MYSSKNVGPRVEPWRTPALTGYSGKVLPSEPLKAICYGKTTKQLRILDPKFHKTLWRIPKCQTFQKGLGISSSTVRDAPDNKTFSNFIRWNYQKVCSWLRRPEIILKIRKKATFLEVASKSIIYKSLPILVITERKLTGQQFLDVDLSQHS